MGSRRGNHEVMVRGTFANIRLRNEIAPGTEGGWTKHMPTNEIMSIYDASLRYKHEKTPLIVIAGREYGSGSSRDCGCQGFTFVGCKSGHRRKLREDPSFQFGWYGNIAPTV